MTVTRAGAAGARVAGPVLTGALVAALIAARWETAVLALAVAAATAAFAGARPPGRTWWLGLAFGAVFALTLNAWLTPGRPLTGVPRLFGHPATFEGLRGGALVVLRMLGALTAVQGLRALLPGDAAADALARALVPFERAGLPVGDARAILGLSARVVPMLRDEWARVARVQRLRAGAPPRGAAARLRALRASAVPALTGALERADRVALALEARHYRVRPLARPGTRNGAPSLAGWSAAAVLVAACALWRG